MKQFVFLLFFSGLAQMVFAQTIPVLPEKTEAEKPQTDFGIEMVTVSGDSFLMGSINGDIDEMPIHSVMLSSFMIGKYEITQAQWYAVMGNNPSHHKECDKCPVERVSREDIQQFFLKLNALTGKNFRLPTEAEWEFAARGGNQSLHYMYSGSNNINDVAWYIENSIYNTHPVGEKKPNELGIFDMTGNVWEWCSDWYNSEYYSNSAGKNPMGHSTGHFRICRGGGWYDYPPFCRTAYRDFGSDLGDWDNSVGLRVAFSR